MAMEDLVIISWNINDTNLTRAEAQEHLDRNVAILQAAMPGIAISLPELPPEDPEPPARVWHGLDPEEAAEAEARYLRNSRDSVTVPDLHFYRQPGGCVEASIQNDQDSDILHFCSDKDAQAFIAEFAQFVADTRPPDEAA